MTKDLIWILVACIFMIFDIVSGLLNAVKNRNVQSLKMREGLWHKCGFLLILALSFGIQYAQTLIDLGFNIPLVIPICSYIIVGETISILENINKISDGRLTDLINKYFKKEK